MLVQHHPRYKKRVPCEFDDADGHHLGMVLNLSQGGLFVSSRVTPRVGSRVVLDFSPREGPAATGVPARVVWKRKVHRSAVALGDGGIGLEIEGAWEVYDHFLKGLVPTLAASSAVAQVCDEARAPSTSLPSFLVRAALRGTPRTRAVEIAAKSAQQAGTAALDSLGEGWQLLEVSAIGQPPDSDDSSS